MNGHRLEDAKEALRVLEIQSLLDEYQGGAEGSGKNDGGGGGAGLRE